MQMNFDKYVGGIHTLFDLRNQLMETLTSFDELNREDFDAIITAGNELVKDQIADFSKQLNLKELYAYIFEVKDSTLFYCKWIICISNSYE